MATKKQQKEEEKREAIDKLKEILKTTKKREVWRNGESKMVPVLYTIIRHVARSGMSRSIDVISISEDGEVYNISYLVKTVLDMKLDTTNGGVKIGGCGMDMGFAIVYNLANKLYGNGYAIHQEWL